MMMTGHIAISHSLASLLKWEFITDDIGINLIIGCLIISRLRRNSILILSIVIISCSYFLVLNWHPQGFVIILKETLFGSLNMTFYNYVFPLFLWLSIYLFGVYIGIGLGNEEKLNGRKNMAWFFGRWSLILLSILIAFKAAIKSLSATHGDIQYLMCATCRYPPSIAFYIFFGGIIFAILFIMFKFNKIYPVRIFMNYAAILGRNSLFVFVIQYYVYYTIFYELRLSYSVIWPLYFIISIAVISALATIWDRKGLNRLITMKIITDTLPVKFLFAFIGHCGTLYHKYV
jgi:hypothetical protein